MKKLVVIGFCLFALAFSAAAQFVLQSFALGTAADASRLATDKWGNVLVAGSFTQAGNTFSVVSKYSPAGALLWSGQTVAGPGTLHAVEVDTDSAGNVFIAGEIRPSQFSPAQLVGGPAFNGPTNRLFMAKYSAAGALLWAQVFNVSTGSYSNRLACAPNGDVLISGGSTWAAGNLGPGFPLTGYQSFIARISGAGNVLWVKQIDYSLHNGGGRIDALEVDASGNIYAAGSYNLSITIEGSSLIGSDAVFIAKFTPQGDLLWLDGNIDQSNQDQIIFSEISVGPTGNLYLAGEYSGITFLFDNVSLASNLYSKRFVLCYSGNGNAVWVKGFGGTNGLDYLNLRSIESDSLSNLYLTGFFSGNITLGSYNLASPTSTDAFFCKLDSVGTVIRAFSGGDPVESDWGREIAIGTDGACYLLATSTTTASGQFSFGGFAVPVASAYVFKVNLTQPFNTLKGSVYKDSNLNGLKDSAEAFAPYRILTVNNSYLSSGPDGLFQLHTDTGNFAITMPSLPLYHNLAPPSYSVNFPTYYLTDSLSHFGLQPNPGQQDLRLSFIASQPPRPGFGYQLNIAYENVGTTMLNGTVQLSLDTVLVWQSSTPVFSAQAGNTLYWNFSNLQPGQQGMVTVQTQVPATTPLGTLFFPAALGQPLAGDLTPQDNSGAFKAEVVGSFDPNDKQVSQNHLTPTEVSEGKYLEYTIRFQNTGTDTAFTVRLIDTLDTQLNIPTFEMLASSHPNTWSIRGNGILEWRFDNILLPDSNTNEPASHGFVKYRIRPNTNLQLGNVIRNTAAIYFDFNAPVITNTATTEIALFSGVTDALKQQLLVYPNPNKGSFLVALQNVQEGSVKAEIRNVLGQVVWQQNLATADGNVQQQIKTHNLSKGVYFLQVATTKGTAVQKVIIE